MMDTRDTFDPRMAKWHPKAREDYENALKDLEARLDADREALETLPAGKREYALRELERRAEGLRAGLKEKYGHPPVHVTGPAPVIDDEQMDLI